MTYWYPRHFRLEELRFLTRTQPCFTVALYAQLRTEFYWSSETIIDGAKVVRTKLMVSLLSGAWSGAHHHPRHFAPYFPIVINCCRASKASMKTRLKVSIYTREQIFSKWTILKIWSIRKNRTILKKWTISKSS